MNKHRNFLTMILTISLYCSNFSDRLISQGKWICQNPWPTSSDLMSIWPINENKIITTGSGGTVLISEDGGLNWVSKRLPTEYGGQRIVFYDYLNGWILDMDKFFQTDNGGYTWNEINTNIYLSKHIYSNILFIDEKIGYILISPSSSYWQDILDNPGQLYKTKDSGKTWNKIDFYFKGAFLCISSIDVNNIFILSKEIISESERGYFLYITKDGGKTWSRNEVQYGGWGRGILQFITPSIGWVGRYKTTDGGITWKDKFPFLSLNGLNGIFFTDINNGWAFDDTAVYYSNNGGGDWIRQYSLESNTRPMDIRFFNKNVGWLCGYGGTIYKTNNGGKNWIRITRGTSNTLYDVGFIDDKYGWIVGENGLIYLSNDYGKNWEKKSKGYTNDLYSLDFIDENNGWVVGDSIILHTTNGGSTWELQSSKDSNYGGKVYFINENIGWIVGNDSTQKGIILYTSDGGRNWITQFRSEITAFSSIQFIDRQYGFAVGSKGTIMKTTDSGNNWIKMNSGSSSIFESLFFIDKNTGWVGGNNKILLKTEDSGESWENVEINDPWTSIFTKIQFIDGLNGWMIDGYNESFFKTTDGGKSWKKINILASGALTSLGTFYFISKDEGWGGGNMSGEIYKTSNGGENWSLVGNLKLWGIRDLFFINKGRGWAIGGNGILKYNYNSLSITKNESSNGSKLNIQSYPNPFNGKTIFNLYSHKTQKVSIKIFDVLGREIEMLLNRTINEGNFSIPWYPQNITSGIYFCQLSTESNSNITKILYVK